MHEIPLRQVDHAVVSALSGEAAQAPKIIANVDLTVPFATVAQWTLVVARDDGPPPPQVAMSEAHGPVTVCFVAAATPDCAARFSPRVPGMPRWFAEPYRLLRTRIVYAGPNHTAPLLLVELCSAMNGYGTCGTTTALYRFDARHHQFVRVFLNDAGRDDNPATRFVQRGPLRGDVIVDYPTRHPPYSYWIEVYAAGRSGRYARILRYRGHTGYADGNPLEVADAEMPQILRHFGLWHHGEALPVPPHLPKGCRHLFMRGAEEWCD